MIKKQRVIAYIDGFNIYYSSLKNTPYKWLDLYKFCNSFLDENSDLLCVKYFSALVTSPPNDKNKTNRQKLYLNALKYNPKIEVQLGSFSMHKVGMPEAEAFDLGKIQLVNVMKTEEKRTDVNLAVQLVVDAYEDKFDYAMLFSNDCDMAKSVDIVHNTCGKRIGIYVDKKAVFNKTLIQNANYIKRISKKPFADNQLSNPVILTDGRKITKPKDWE